MVIKFDITVKQFTTSENGENGKIISKVILIEIKFSAGSCQSVNVAIPNDGNNKTPGISFCHWRSTEIEFCLYHTFTIKTVQKTSCNPPPNSVKLFFFIIFQINITNSSCFSIDSVQICLWPKMHASSKPSLHTQSRNYYLSTTGSKRWVDGFNPYIHRAWLYTGITDHCSFGVYIDL